jgi:hypothetical protein
MRFVLGAPKRPSHPAPNVRDDRDTPLAGAGWSESLAMICPTAKAEYFCARDWTVDSGLIGLGNFDFWRNGFGRGIFVSRTRRGMK